MTTIDAGAAPMRTFRRVWLGQLLALAATAVTDFVLSVWVLERTGSVTQYSLISVFIVLAGIVSSPFIGVAADRTSRRRMLILSNSSAAVVAALVALLDQAGQLQVWHVYLAAAVVSVCVSTHFVVCQTLVGTMLPPAQQGRAIGMLMIVPGFQIAAPVVGAALYAGVGIRGVALIEVCVALVAVANLVGVRLPEPDPADADAPAPSIRADLAFGVRYLRDRPLLLRYVILVVTVVPFVMGLAGLLVRPLILGFGSVGDLSLMMFLGGAGFLTGSVLLSLTGGPKRKAYGVWGALTLGGVILALHAVRPSLLLIGIVAPLFLFLVPVITACSQSLMIRKLDPPVIGRIMGVTRTASQVFTGLAYLLAGPLVDQVLNPATTPGGTLTWLEPVIGTGGGRGVAVAYLGCGLLFTALGVYGWLHRDLRALDTVLPDGGGTAAAAGQQPVDQPADEQPPDPSPASLRNAAPTPRQEP